MTIEEKLVALETAEKRATTRAWLDLMKPLTIARAEAKQTKKGK